MAATGSPTSTAAELPSGTGISARCRGSTLTTPTSAKTSQPTMVAAIRSRSSNSTKIRVAGRTASPGERLPASVTTWALVRIVPSLETTNPEPWLFAAEASAKTASMVTTPLDPSR